MPRTVTDLSLASLTLQQNARYRASAHDNDNDNNGFRVLVSREHADREVTVQALSRGLPRLTPNPRGRPVLVGIAERPGRPLFNLRTGRLRDPPSRRCL